MDPAVKKAPNSALRLFFTVYQDATNRGQADRGSGVPAERESLTKVPMELLGRRRAQGRIPYLMTIPAEAVPA